MLAPTKRSFEAGLRLYYRTATADEIEAMLAHIKAPLDELMCGRWAARTKAQHGHEIRQAFMKADKNGDGGIDVSECDATPDLG